ncbi:MAG: type transport system permease protein [Thermococcaceae archaeon]|jgi:ABC-2 type transport system permease protein|uniref:ABC transporter permease n=1 Tax=Thermococcus TaxID=2263 RepID=UPI0005B2D131|nr:MULTISPECIES: ABC transporter permease [Thermococcus]ALV61954.1 ABC transporter, permease protein [Thermococcus sp. 2319x1]MCO6040229.1 ABC transporter permease [Thermococcus alcaliphilus]MDK2853967.1 type transport system permease protein [Thermococcaceae archaeon]MDN5321137.1 type transport system permease protein [Thermococcaceae archaeon]
MLGQTLILIERELLSYKRSVGFMIASFLSPLMYLFVFGYTLNKGMPSINGVSYLNYILPGIIMLVVIYSSLNSATRVFIERKSHALLDLLSLPMNKSLVPFVKILIHSLLSAFNALMFLLLAKLTICSELYLSIDNIPVLFLAIFSSSFAVGIFMMGIAASLREEQSFNSLTSLFLLPMIFISTAYYPVSLMPAVLKTLARINPISFGADLIRNILFGIEIPISEMISFVVFSIVGISLLHRSFGKYFK